MCTSMRKRVCACAVCSKRGIVHQVKEYMNVIWQSAKLKFFQTIREGECAICFKIMKADDEAIRMHSVRCHDSFRFLLSGTADTKAAESCSHESLCFFFVLTLQSVEATRRALPFRCGGFPLRYEEVES
jgi:hypothetical protein